MVWSPTPALRALSALQVEVARYVYGTTDSTQLAALVDGLNDGLARISTRERWPWLLTSENVTLVAGTEAYELATAPTKKVRHVHLLDSADKEKSQLFYKDPKTFVVDHADRSVNGSPGFYTAFNIVADGKIDLSVPPDAGFVASYPKLKVRILKRMLRFSSASTSQTLADLGGGTPELESFLVWHAKGVSSMDIAPEKAGPAFSRAEEFWDSLVRDSNREGDFY